MDAALKVPANPGPVELPLFAETPVQPDADWLLDYLKGRDWVRASEILRSAGKPPTEDWKRRVRAAAEASGGRVAGHQRGYKLVREMTGEEYNWWRNEWLKSANAIRSRILKSDRIFYSRR